MPVAAFLALVLCAPVSISRLYAAEASDTLDLPDARARSAGAPAPAAGVHRLEGEALRRFASLEDALESLPGFRVRQRGGLGGYSELSFRGARAAQVDVYVDGVRLNQDGSAAPDLSRWPLLWFSSLEARTGYDDRSGPGALARIDLATHSAGDGSASLRARLGSFATAEAALSTQARSGAWTWSAGAQGQSAANDYRFFSDNGTLYNTADDGVWRMRNNAYYSRGARAGARREVSGPSFSESQSFSLLWLESRKEYPGLWPASASAHGERSEWLAAWRLDRSGTALAWGAGAQLRRAEDAYRDPGQSLGYLSYESARAALAGEAELSARRALGPVALRGDVKLRGEESGPKVTPFSDAHSAPDARRLEAQAGAGLEGRVPGIPSMVAALDARQSFARFRAEGVVVGDTAGTVASADAFARALRAAAEWRRQGDNGTFALGAVARVEQRAPSSGELLGDNLGVRPKLDLEPEETRGASLSGQVFGRWGGVGATGFWNRYSDPIRLRAHTASPFMRHENGADYEAFGVEARASWTSRVAEAGASATLQEMEILEGLYAGNRPAYESPLEGHAEVFLKPARGARLGPTLRYRGPVYPGDANVAGTRRDPEWEWDLHASLERGRARAAFDARNLTDRRYRDFIYSPRSGRSYSLSFSVTL
jgi:hypothetical protein